MGVGGNWVGLKLLWVSTLCLTPTLAAVGCSAPTRAALYGPSSRVLAAEDYPEVLATWTRSTKVYQGLENKMFVTATLHSPEFRRAFAIAFPEIYGHGGEITKRELVNLTGDIEQYHNLFLVVYTPNRKWNDLAKSDSIWRLTLIGSNEVAVGSHEVISVKIDENLRAVYPHISRFDEAYLVRFPLSDPMSQTVVTATSTSMQLRLASALGVAELAWVLVPLGAAEPVE